MEKRIFVKQHTKSKGLNQPQKEKKMVRPLNQNFYTNQKLFIYLNRLNAYTLIFKKLNAYTLIFKRFYIKYINSYNRHISP